MPLGMMWDEEQLLIRCQNAKAVTEATLIQAAISSVLSEEGGRHFSELVQTLAPDED